MLDINKQKMIYALKDGRTPVYQLNKDGSIKYIIVDGEEVTVETGEYTTGYEKPVVLLLDEYDVPIAKASSNGYYSQMLDVMRAMMSTTLKDNTSLDFAVVTG